MYTCSSFFFFFFNDTATTEIYTLSLHDALPSSRTFPSWGRSSSGNPRSPTSRSEEHTSELQSQFHLVCRLLLEKKKNKLVTIKPIEKKRRIEITERVRVND